MNLLTRGYGWRLFGRWWRLKPTADLLYSQRHQLGCRVWSLWGWSLMVRAKEDGDERS